MLLDGLGTDGTAGVTATKKLGGPSIAEVAEGGAPEGDDGVGPLGVVDLRLPVQDIALHIPRYAENIANPAAHEDAGQIAADV